MANPLDILFSESARLRGLTHAPSTLRAYRFAWDKFENWCRVNKRAPLPASQETVLLYLTDIMRQGRRVVTANQRAAGINYHHAQQNHQPPAGSAVKALLRGARRDRCEAPLPKQPITVDLLRKICAVTSKRTSLLDIRDHAIITLGFGSALRRSNLVALDLADIAFVRQGLVVRVTREKNDQLGAGRFLGVAKGSRVKTDPVWAMKRWLLKRGSAPGPLFTPVRGPKRRLNPDTIGRAVKRVVQGILDPADVAAHSLRSGFVTTAGDKNLNPLVIAGQTGHGSLDSLKRYFRSADLFRASRSVGL